MTNVNNDRVVSAVKQWLTPGLISIVGMMVWSQLSELRTDVKTLLINQGVTQTRITILERDVEYLKNSYNYASRAGFSSTSKPIAKKEEGPQIPEPDCSEDLRKKSY